MDSVWIFIMLTLVVGGLFFLNAYYKVHTGKTSLARDVATRTLAFGVICGYIAVVSGNAWPALVIFVMVSSISVVHVVWLRPTLRARFLKKEQ